jgi:hypothetical protein
LSGAKEKSKGETHVSAISAEEADDRTEGERDGRETGRKDGCWFVFMHPLDPSTVQMGPNGL